jgi:hypothetical protein
MRKFLIVSLLICLFAAPALAAGGSLTLSASSLKVQVGKTFSVAVKATSNGVTANTVGADIAYPADLLDVVSVSGPSVITLPIANGFVSPGLVSFQGGIIPSKIFSSSPVGTILFKTKGEGTATIHIASTSGIYADDGNGTDLLVSRGTVSVLIEAAAPPDVEPPVVNKPVIPPPVIEPPIVNTPTEIQPPMNIPNLNQPINAPEPTPSTPPQAVSADSENSRQTFINIAIGLTTATFILIIYFIIWYPFGSRRKKKK